MRIDFLNSDKTMNAMERYLDLSTRRQSLVHSNLANIDTPGFHVSDINTDQEIKSELGRGGELNLHASSGRHFSRHTRMKTHPEAFEVEGLNMRNDMNNVDLDKEMLKLYDTSMKFSLFAQLLRSEFRSLLHAITEGR